MFGYIRARQDTLPEGDWDRYQAVYCGLCHTLKEEYGLTSRMFLNYDFVFLAMILAPAGELEPVRCAACLAHPLKKRSFCPASPWLEEAAGKSVILTWWKLHDARQDEKGLKGCGAMMLQKCLKKACCKASELYPSFSAVTAQRLQELQEMERDGVSSIDRTADAFAQLLAAAAPETGDAFLDRPRQELLYQIGRWIYLIDALDDLERDRRDGQYNPLLLRFPRWGEEEQRYLRHLLDQTLDRAGAAYQLLPVTGWSSILENILYSGLPGVEGMVFSGEWTHQKTHRRVSYE